MRSEAERAARELERAAGEAERAASRLDTLNLELGGEACPPVSPRSLASHVICSVRHADTSTDPRGSAMLWLKHTEAPLSASAALERARTHRAVRLRTRALADAYRTLGLDSTATTAEITTAYEV